MEGLTQSYMLKQKLLNCEPIDLIRFVVDLRDSHLEFWTSFSDSATAKRLLIISGAHCLHKELWLPILPIGFPGTCFLTFLEMLSAAWLVSDFASTTYALKPQLGVLPLPLLATYVRLMIMSRMKSMFSFTARTLRWCLFAGSTGRYFHRHDRMFLLFYTRTTTNSFFHS